MGAALTVAAVCAPFIFVIYGIGYGIYYLMHHEEIKEQRKRDEHFRKKMEEIDKWHREQQEEMRRMRNARL